MPEFPRQEVYHALIVHFPVAFLPLATLLWCLVIVAGKREGAAWLRPSARLLLYVGTLLAWAAVISGDKAESIVNRVICDPSVTHRHEEWGERAAITYTVAFAIDLLAWGAQRIMFQFAEMTRRVTTALIAVACLVGLGMLVQAGHLGAELVYQQGAGVYRTSPECKEFE